MTKLSTLSLFLVAVLLILTGCNSTPDTCAGVKEIENALHTTSELYIHLNGEMIEVKRSVFLESEFMETMSHDIIRTEYSTHVFMYVKTGDTCEGSYYVKQDSM